MSFVDLYNDYHEGYEAGYSASLLEIEKLKQENKEGYHKGFIDGITSSKYIIGNKKEELEEKDKMFKLELPEDVTIYQYVIEVLEELLEMIKW